MSDTVIAPRYQMRYEQLVNTPALDRIPYFHDREIEYILEVSKAEQENVALKAQIQDWRLPAKDRDCPFCTHPDYVTRGHAHFHKGVIDHAGVVCTDYVGFVAQMLFEAKVQNIALKDQLRDEALAFTHANEIVGKLEAENVALRAKVAKLEAPVSNEEWETATDYCPCEAGDGDNLSDEAFYRGAVQALIAARGREGE